MKKIVVLVLVAALSCISFTRGAKNSVQNKVDVVLSSSADSVEHLAYSDEPLRWDDFKGSPDITSPWDAMLYSGIAISYKYHYRKGATYVQVIVTPYMNRQRSWYKPTGFNPLTLQHEQRHFDITAIVAAQLADQIRNTVFTSPDFKGTISALHRYYMARLAEMQHQYDDETEHGYRSRMQDTWNGQIADRLALIQR